MNVIKIEGLTGCYPEGIEGTTEWYFCKEGKDNFCDLYEAEEIYKVSKIFGGMNCDLIHFPEGTLHSPFKLRENLYVESPIWDNGKIYFLSVDFSMNLIQIHCYFPEERRLESIKELPLDVVEDCYNLRLETTPLMLCRSGNNGFFEIIWPERKKIEIGDRETIIFRHGEDLYFSEWYEDPDYHENVIIRDLNTGKVKDKFEGNLLRLPNEVFWRI